MRLNAYHEKIGVLKGGLALMKEKDLHLAESIESLINVLGRLRKSILKSLILQNTVRLTIAQYQFYIFCLIAGPVK